jgi:hypothetical protein
VVPDLQPRIVGEAYVSAQEAKGVIVAFDLDDVVTANNDDGLVHVVNMVDNFSSSVWTECGVMGYDLAFTKSAGPVTCFTCIVCLPYTKASNSHGKYRRKERR